MGSQLEARLFSVGALFAESGTHYEIPIYQRNYAWRNEQIDQLIEDVWAATQDPRAEEYFLGNLIVAPKVRPSAAKGTVFEVVDGQQRLTTLYLLLARLWSPLAAKLTYASRRSATDALARLSLSEDDEGSGILTGYKAIDARVSRLFQDPVHRTAFLHFLTNQVQLVRAVLPGNTDLNRYFEIMNTRGQQLEQVDIVKARLMSYLRSDTDDLEEQRACMAWIWDACADMDSYVQMTLPGRDPALRSRLFGDTWDSLRARTFAELVALRPQGDDRARMRSEPVGLRDALSIYARSPEKPSDNDDVTGRFETPIKFPHLLLHALKVMGNDEENAREVDGHLDDGRLIRIFEDSFRDLAEEERAQKVRRFIETLLRAKFVLDNYVLKREYTSTNGEDGAWSLKRLARGEYKTKNGQGAETRARFPSAYASTPEESDASPTDEWTRRIMLLQSLLRVTYTSPRTMHWITELLRLPVDDAATTRPQAALMIETRLLAYARQKVHHSLRDEARFTSFSIERIVYTYLDYLLTQGAGNWLTPDNGFVFVFRNSVEHFFPQHPDDGDAGSDAVTPGDRELNMFGNLALISVSANSKFSNALPLAKITKEREIRKSKKLELMAKITKDKGRWDRDSIRQHDKAMVDVLWEDLASAGYLRRQATARGLETG